MLLMLMLAVGCFQRTDDHHHPHRPETAADRNMQLVERAANALNDLSPRRSDRALALTTHAASASNGLDWLSVPVAANADRPTSLRTTHGSGSSSSSRWGAKPGRAGAGGDRAHS